MLKEPEVVVNEKRMMLFLGSGTRKREKKWAMDQSSESGMA
jgi:hypothetical protein